MSTVKNPQEKKKLSYSKDRRNAYGESDKGSRKSIPKNKRSSIHAERSKEIKLKQILTGDLEEDYISKLESDINSETKLKKLQGFKKYPDQSLKEHVENQQSKREIRYGRKKNS